MDRFPYAAEYREDQIAQLIDARIHAIKHDIRANRASTVAAVLERLDLGDFEGDGAEVLRLAVVGHSAAVGVDHAAAVEAAIYFEAEALAERDVADMERRRAEAAQHARIEQRVWNEHFPATSRPDRTGAPRPSQRAACPALGSVNEGLLRTQKRSHCVRCRLTGRKPVATQRL